MHEYELEITSHPLCPFSQRSIILLLQKGLRRDADFKVSTINYADFGNFPEWFLQRSPTAAMPVLTVNETENILKDNAINEFLDEITSGSLFSVDALRRAEERMWTEKAGDLLNALRDVYTGKTHGEVETAVRKVFELLAPVEEKVTENQRYSRGDRFTMVDAAFAPFFMLFRHFDRLKNAPDWEKLPKTKFWAESLLNEKTVIDSACKNYSQEFDNFFKLFNSYFPQFAQES